MSLLLLVRKVSILACVAVVVSGVSNGQSYTNNGSEYSVSGGLAGDQVIPGLSISTNGGYLVWQDRWTDGDGWGIRGMALDNQLKGVFAPFRVNAVGAGDQENARVALLQNNGAVFVWQGGQNGFQHIFARFLSPSNTWATGDIAVNTFKANFQIDPAVAVLEDGSVVIAWSSYDQAGDTTLRDVYARRFSADGGAIGDEFLVNQFTAYNQRTPAVVGLKNGGFVVGWVSEQQRKYANLIDSQPYSANQIPQPSVDVYARIYDSTGKPVGNEFPVNTHSNVCANPSLVASEDGGFTAAWSEKDGQVRNNSWDVFACHVSLASGSIPSIGAESRLNTQLYGDQFAPRLANIGSQSLVVWTSLGQDGSMEGVYGRYLSADGSLVGDEFRINTTTVSKQMQPAVATDHSQRFLAVWTSFVGGSNSFDLYGQRYAPPGYVEPALATNYLAPEFVADNTSTNSDGPTNTPPDSTGGHSPVLQFPGPIVQTGTNVVSDPIEADQGLYYGLFYDTNGVSTSSSGYITVKATKKGSFSAKLVMAQGKLSASGKIDPATGLATASGGRGNLSLNVTLQLDLSGGTHLGGTVSGNGWVAEIFATRQTGDSVQGYAGSYTMALPAVTTQAAVPSGNGFGTLKVNANGKVKWKGVLGDGTKVSQGTAISDEGILPLFVTSRGGDFVIGWLQVTNRSTGKIGGDVIWTTTNPGQNAGFTNHVEVLGSRYTGRVAPVKPLAVNPTVLILSNGGLGESLTYHIGVDARNKITAQEDVNKFKLKVSSSGLFKGTVADPGTGGVLKIQGAFLEQSGVGLGCFENGGQNGGVYFGPIR